jgi:hypothetical protein
LDAGSWKLDAGCWKPGGTGDVVKGRFSSKIPKPDPKDFSPFIVVKDTLNNVYDLENRASFKIFGIFDF